MSRRFGQRVRQIVVAKCGDRCAYCGVVDLDLGVGHLLPTSKGGSDDLENLMPTCQKCASKKAGRTLERMRWTESLPVAFSDDQLAYLRRIVPSAYVELEALASKHQFYFETIGLIIPPQPPRLPKDI